MRAVIERHGEAAKSYPKIQTLIVKGKEDLSIRITDHGGGIPHSKLPQIFKYMYSTAPKPSLDSDVYTASSNAPLVSFILILILFFYFKIKNKFLKKITKKIQSNLNSIIISPFLKAVLPSKSSSSFPSNSKVETLFGNAGSLFTNMVIIPFKKISLFSFLICINIY